MVHVRALRRNRNSTGTRSKPLSFRFGQIHRRAAIDHIRLALNQSSRSAMRGSKILTGKHSEQVHGRSRHH